MTPGQIYRHSHFYTGDDGKPKPKFFLILAIGHGGDIVTRLLTSGRTGTTRPEQPPCFHGDPYPGFFLGVLGGSLSTKSWLDLRGQDEFDADLLALNIRKGIITLEDSLTGTVFRDALLCAAAANDTSRRQERAMRDEAAKIP